MSHQQNTKIFLINSMQAEQRGGSNRKKHSSREPLVVQQSRIHLPMQRLPSMQEARVRSLGWEDPLQEATATHSKILAWKIPWTEKPRGLQSMGVSRARRDLGANPLHQSLVLQIHLGQMSAGSRVAMAIGRVICSSSIFSSFPCIWEGRGCVPDFPQQNIKGKDVLLPVRIS